MALFAPLTPYVLFGFSLVRFVVLYRVNCAHRFRAASANPHRFTGAVKAVRDGQGAHSDTTKSKRFSAGMSSMISSSVGFSRSPRNSF